MSNEFNSDFLNKRGLNLQSIFNIDELPKDMIDALQSATQNLSEYNQLIMIGHGGKALWNSLTSQQLSTSDPIDDHSIQTFKNLNLTKFKIIYPGETIIPLQSLGIKTGWHHPSLFRIGINEKWGAWFAYRVVALTRSNFKVTPKMSGNSPCANCTTKDCVSACPVGAVTEESFQFEKCFKYRKTANSKCKDRCLARMACPVSKGHQYPMDQIKYHYGRSLKSLKNM